MSSSVNSILKHRTLNTLKPGVLTVSAYPNFYPVCYYKDKSTTIEGLDVDIVLGFCKEAGLTVEFKIKNDFNGIWEDPSKEVSDLSIGGIGISKERTSKNTEWTIPYFYVYRTVVYNKKEPIKHFPSDVRGIVRGTVGSTGWIDGEKKLRASHKIKYLKPGHSDQDDIHALLEGKIDGLMRGSFVGEAIVKQHPKQLGMVKPWEIDPSLVSSDGECFAYPCNKDSGVSTAMSTYLTELWMDGGLKKLAHKYGLE